MKSFFLALLLLAMGAVSGQKPKYTHADSLRGSYSAARAWWDVLHYDLQVAFNIPDSSISGRNRITYKVLSSYSTMQLDLMEPMVIDSIIENGKSLSWRRDGNAFF